MNGFADHSLDEGAFGEKKGFSDGLRTFDAFRMSFRLNLIAVAFLLRCVQLTILSLSQNETHLHPALLNRRLHNPPSHPNQHHPLLHRAPPLVFRPRNTPLQRREGRLPRTAN